MKYKFAFVVLNYGLFETTVTCVDNLLEKLAPDSLVVVVDNGSADGSGAELAEKYKDDPGVKVIQLDQNIGFSRGLNVGFQYAKQEGYSFIALINNDTWILSDNICGIIEQDYAEYRFDILGPHIDNPNGEKSPDVNPYRGVEKPDLVLVNAWEQMIKKSSVRIRMDDFHLGVPYLKAVESVKTLYHRLRPAQEPDLATPEDREKMILGCGLHGCYWIFGPDYVRKYDGLRPVTFLYGEEWLLYRQAKLDGLVMMYDPRIRIWHDEHSVEKKQTGHELQKYYAKLRIQRESYQRIIDFVKEERARGRCFDQV